MCTETGEPLTLRRRKPRLLLAMLLLRNGRTVSTRELARALWQDAPPPSARANLHAYLSALRKQLGAGLLTTAHDGYRVHVETGDLDSDLFGHLVAEARTAARTGRPQQAVRRFTAALNLWRGDVLEGLELTGPLRDETAGLRELRLSAEDELMGAYLDAGEQAHVVAEFRRLVRAEPFRERRWGRLMEALHGSGRAKEALETYQELYALLDSELGLEPGEELRALHSRILAATGPDGNTPLPHPRWRGARPYVTVVGRDRERAELAGLALRHRLVTVTGPGGCGKSTLALDTAHMVAASFTDGVTVIGPAEAGTTLPDALPGPSTGRHALVVLDDCERLPGSATVARRLLSQPGSTVLAASRTPLGISGEVTWPLAPLPTPEADEETAATRLFLQRAAEAAPGFHVEAGHRALVSGICRRLDGLPLAVELAAARLRVLSLQELAERLDDSLDCLLAPAPGASAQHDTLTSAFGWAHARLGAQEQQLLRPLAALEGEFSLVDAAEAASPHLRPACVLQALVTLVEQSFVQSRDTPGGRRFRLLEPIRAFVAQVEPRERERGDHGAVLGAGTYFSASSSVSDGEHHTGRASAKPFSRSTRACQAAEGISPSAWVP
ncbi:hypothetical protein C1I97_09935 [Streptomyces sp. NTH33]|nr:hypothetical protein C1I97_09935 [Streptomyces sp. NTH33]